MITSQVTSCYCFSCKVTFTEHCKISILKLFLAYYLNKIIFPRHVSVEIVFNDSRSPTIWKCQLFIVLKIRLTTCHAICSGHHTLLAACARSQVAAVYLARTDWNWVNYSPEENTATRNIDATRYVWLAYLKNGWKRAGPNNPILSTKNRKSCNIWYHIPT